MLEMIKTVDIAKTLGQEKRPEQISVGFALETNNEIQNAEKKLASKNLDFIVLNSLQDKGAGFNHDTNKITIIDKNKQVLPFGLKPKNEVAVDIINTILRSESK